MHEGTIRVEAATRGVLCERVFLEISQNSQENTCARVSFLIKLQDNTSGRLLLQGKKEDHQKEEDTRTALMMSL